MVVRRLLIRQSDRLPMLWPTQYLLVAQVPGTMFSLRMPRADLSSSPESSTLLQKKEETIRIPRQWSV